MHILWECSGWIKSIAVIDIIKRYFFILFFDGVAFYISVEIADFVFTVEGWRVVKNATEMLPGRKYKINESLFHLLDVTYVFL